MPGLPVVQRDEPAVRRPARRDHRMIPFIRRATNAIIPEPCKSLRHAVHFAGPDIYNCQE